MTAGTSTTDTTVFDAATNAAWTGTETAGAHAFDTASVIPSAGITATGTVTYTFFPNAACTGTGTPAGTVTLTWHRGGAQLGHPGAAGGRHLQLPCRLQR